MVFSCLLGSVSMIPLFIAALMLLYGISGTYQPTVSTSMFEIVKGDLQDSIGFLKFEKPIFIQVCLVVAGLNLFLSSMITIGIPVIITQKLFSQINYLE